MSATTHPTLTAVGELIRTRTMRIDLTKKVSYQVHGECLLAILAEMVTSSANGNGGRTIPHSKPPIAIDAADLWYWITYDTHAWAQLLSVDKKRFSNTPHNRRRNGIVIPPIPPVGRLLRHVAAQAISTGREELADRIHTNATTWAHRIEHMATGHTEQRGVRGAPCPACAQVWVAEQRDEDSGRHAVYRVPAVVLVTHGDPQLACLGCGWSQALVGEGSELVGVAA